MSVCTTLSIFERKMGVDTILLLIAGSIAVIAAVTIASIRGAFGRFRLFSRATADSQIGQTIAPQSKPAQTAMVVEQNITVQEAPAPFPEDSAAKTTVPTDVSAITSLTSVAPVLVIPTPKRVRASRRLPSTGTTETTRKRRSSKAKTTVPDVSAGAVSTDIQAPTGSTSTEGMNTQN